MIDEASGKTLPAWASNRWLWIFGLAICIELPLTFVRTVAKYSRVSTVTCVLIAWYLVHSAYYLILRVEDHNFDPDHKLEYFAFNKFFIGALGIEAFAYHCHATVGPSLARLKNPTRTRKYGVVAALSMAGALCYLTAGLLPYLTLVDGVDNQVIFNCYPPHQVFTMITKGIYGLFLIITAPLLLYTGRLCAVRTFCKEFPPQWKMDLYGVLMLGISALTAAGVKSISVMFDFLGGVAISSIMYIFPALFYIRICENESTWKYWVAWILVPLGTAEIAVSLYHSITSLINGD
jgi:sodium-coupled neutral amino acid transporter 11